MSASIENPHFLLRRLHSLLGVIPVGAFLIFHLWENSQSRLGAEHYNQAVVAALREINYLPVIEILVIALPLLFHAVYGLRISLEMWPEPLRYRYLRNAFYLLQRLSGIGILVFLLLHVGMTRIAGLWAPDTAADLYALMQTQLAMPWMFGLYLVGLLLAVFHLANGIATAAIVWGLTTSVSAQRWFGYVMAVFGVVLALLGIQGLLGFRA